MYQIPYPLLRARKIVVPQYTCHKSPDIRTLEPHHHVEHVPIGITFPELNVVARRLQVKGGDPQMQHDEGYGSSARRARPISARALS